MRYSYSSEIRRDCSKKKIVERLQNVSMVSVPPNLADINGTRALVRTFEIGYTECGEASRMDVDLNEIHP